MDHVMDTIDGNRHRLLSLVDNRDQGKKKERISPPLTMPE